MGRIHRATSGAAGRGKPDQTLPGGPRGAFLHQSTQNGTSATADGVLLGGGGGILFGLGGMHLDVGALVALAKFGEVKINGAGTGFKPNGTVVVLRAGLVFGRQ
jgi:hypothetical protein